ncbi:hypothetical protein D4764_11G0001560 [Takifugu flavidus]|uniref:Uncharacterized protein n=1 Tax=Takifugu flavidus TaxID=433684 RepID=A0A5C6PFA1_9TELE|nr:hypothetical protein D4764_11G0001560 [Takifugu flavidus]
MDWLEWDREVNGLVILGQRVTVLSTCGCPVLSTRGCPVLSTRGCPVLSKCGCPVLSKCGRVEINDGSRNLPNSV